MRGNFKKKKFICTELIRRGGLLLQDSGESVVPCCTEEVTILPV